jgi:hypothetical protein
MLPHLNAHDRDHAHAHAHPNLPKRPAADGQGHAYASLDGAPLQPAAPTPFDVVVVNAINSAGQGGPLVVRHPGGASERLGLVERRAQVEEQQLVMGKSWRRHASSAKWGKGSGGLARRMHGIQQPMARNLH